MQFIDPVDAMRSFLLSTPGRGESGPFSLEQIGGMWKAGQIHPNSRLRETGFEDWLPITDLRREFPSLFGGHSPNVRPSASSSATRREREKVRNYRILGLLLGGAGVHNFYAGEIVSGVGKLILFAIGLGLGSFAETASASGMLYLVVMAWCLAEIIRGEGFEPAAR